MIAVDVTPADAALQLAVSARSAFSANSAFSASLREALIIAGRERASSREVTGFNG